MSSLDCTGCLCIKKNMNDENDDAEYCGRIRRHGGTLKTYFGCDIKCPQCKNCKYESYDGKSNNNNDSTSSTSNNNKKNSRSFLGENDFLNFLKTQEEINSYESDVYGVVTQDENDNQNNNFMADNYGLDEYSYIEDSSNP